MTSWLPALEEFPGNWPPYCDHIYALFCADLMDVKNPRPNFQGMPMMLKNHPIIDGKTATFWHVISEGKTEEERTPDFRRCERIRWIRPLIAAVGQRADVRYWKQTGRDRRWAVALEDFSYVVILAERDGYVLLWTAFYIEQPHRRRKLQREYEEATKNGA